MQVVVVPTTGDTLVVTQRLDLDLDSEDGMARELAFADNRVAELAGFSKMQFWPSEPLDS